MASKSGQDEMIPGGQTSFHIRPSVSGCGHELPASVPFIGSEYCMAVKTITSENRYAISNLRSRFA